MKSLCLQSGGIAQSLAVCLLIVASLCLVGLSEFRGRLNYCALLQGGWFYQKSKWIALDAAGAGDGCLDEPWKADFLLQHELSQLLPNRTHAHSFENLLLASESVLHLMFGSEIFSTIELLNSLRTPLPGEHEPLTRGDQP